MGDTVSPRINLAQSLKDIPKAGTVEVKFDYVRPNKVRLGDHKNIDVDRGKLKILFDLDTKHVPTSASASIVGIEFPPGEANRAHPPSEVFENPHTIKTKGDPTVYGEWKGNKHELKLIDDNWPDGEQLYGYRVWVEVDFGSRKEYFCSEDPQIKNKPTD